MTGSGVFKKAVCPVVEFPWLLPVPCKTKTESSCSTIHRPSVCLLQHTQSEFFQRKILQGDCLPLWMWITYSKSDWEESLDSYRTSFLYFLNIARKKINLFTCVCVGGGCVHMVLNFTCSCDEIIAHEIHQNFLLILIQIKHHVESVLLGKA